MKITKKTIILLGVIAVACVLIGTFIGSALTTSNTITITPQSVALTISADNYVPPFGSVVNLEVDLGVAVNDVIVTFYANTVSIGTAPTVAGIATLPYTITSLDVVYSYATIPT